MDGTTFAERLRLLMIRKGISQSGLAARVWGTATDARGRAVARNRDRISQYVRGLAMPRPSNLLRIAEALGVDPGELNPPAGPEATVCPAPRALAMEEVEGQPGKVRLRVNVLTNLRAASEVITLLAKDAA